MERNKGWARALPERSVAYDLVKTDQRSLKQKYKNQPIIRPGIEHFDWFISPLLLLTPTIKFSLDC